MKLRKLLKKLNDYLNEDEKQLQDKDDGLSSVLKKLKIKEMDIQHKIEIEMDEDERKFLEQELKIVHSQREKGIHLLSEMRGRKNVQKPEEQNPA
ncbi:MAG: hypothetical protein AUJ57_09020 [Zetaproteobacteria bacterium CG1_02_53_45]|nr:MAG: hypothetical protein AUJ57_09020 [Zetaproteobacteria bacterium CG1_02_53_45]